MLKIESRRWVAVWYKCPLCGAQSGELMLTPWRWTHRRVNECLSFKCNRAELAVVEHRWYTTFCIESGLSQTTIAGTLAKIGPFRLCDLVQPDIRAFRRWYRERRAEADEKARLYFEHERKVEAEWKVRREQQAREAALLKEAEAVAYRRVIAPELAAEQVARAVWPVEQVESRPARPVSPPPMLGDDDFDPFLDVDE